MHTRSPQGDNCQLEKGKCWVSSKEGGLGGGGVAFRMGAFSEILIIQAAKMWRGTISQSAPSPFATWPILELKKEKRKKKWENRASQPFSFFSVERVQFRKKRKTRCRKQEKKNRNQRSIKTPPIFAEWLREKGSQRPDPQNPFFPPQLTCCVFTTLPPLFFSPPLFVLSRHRLLLLLNF